MSRQNQDYNRLLRLVALKGAIYSTNIERVKRHSHRCKSKNQVELTLKEFKTPLFSSDERKKLEFLGASVGSWGQNYTMGHGAMAESVVVRVRGRISPQTS